MPTLHPLAGVYAAAVTPLHPDFSVDRSSIPSLLSFLAGRGCSGALLLGTTGEGPSFSPTERIDIFRAALEVRQVHPEFNLLAGTGTPSLEETIEITRAAFDLGLDGVVVLPPYYFRSASDEGLFAWFSQVLRRAVPTGGIMLGYHIPSVTGVPLSLDLLSRLKDAFPASFRGLKDSSADLAHARQLGKRFGEEFLIFNGTDSLFTHALHAGASGCITALANLMSPMLGRVWQVHCQGRTDPRAQELLTQARHVLEKFPPAPPFLKAILSRQYDLPRWAVRPPLLPLTSETEEQAVNAVQATRND